MTQRDNVALHCLVAVSMCVACATAIDEGSDSSGRSDLGADGASGGTSPSGGAGGSVSPTGSGGSAVASGGSATGSGGTSASGGSASGGAGTGGAGSGGTSASGGSASGGSGGTAPSGTMLFFDDFESGSDAWISAPSDGWSIVTDGTMVFSQGTLDTTLRLSAAGDTSWTDQIVEARVKLIEFTGQSSSYQASVHARFQNVDNSYAVTLQSNGEVKIKKRSGGSETSISSSADVEVQTGTWYTVALHAVGSQLTAYIDDQPVLSVNDTSFASGGVALGTKNATAMFDDVLVTAP